MTTPADSETTALLEQGLEHHKSGNLYEAETAYRKILDRDPRHPDALHFLGLLAAQGGAGEDGIKLIGESLSIKPGNAAAHSNLGHILRDAGRLDEAAEHHRKSAEIDPDFAPAYADLGGILMAQGKFAEAVDCFEKTLLLDPAHLESRFLLGNACHGLGRLDEAARHYKALLQARPNVAQAHNNLGNVYQDLNRLDDALAAYRRALEIEPDFVLALNNLGVLHAARGETDEAVMLYRQAVEKMPDAVDLQLNLAMALRAHGNPAEAERCLNRARELAPDNPEIPFNLGIVLYDLGKIEDAATAYEQAVALDADMVGALCNLGTIRQEQERYDEAIGYFRRAIEAGGELAPAYVNLGNALQAHGEKEEAIACYEKAQAISPTPETETTLRQLKAQQLPRWHFPMLADARRNKAFRAAIEKVVDDGSHVLDIGTGSGLLAMMAARAGAAHVTACEVSAPVAAIAGKIVAQNGLSDRITVVAKRSNTLVIGEDMEKPADVVIAEVFDQGLIREGALPTLRHAVHRLAAPGATLIPRAATVKGVLVEMPALRAVNPIKEIEGFDLSAFDDFRSTYLNMPDLNREPHRRLSDAFVIAAYDFAALKPVASGRDEVKVLDVPIIEKGAVQAIVYWFDLDLADGVTYSTGPSEEKSHWGQALQFFDTDTAVEAGATVPLTVRLGEMQIAFKV